MHQTDADLNAIIRQTVADTLTGMVGVMAAAAQEFAERTADATEEMREEAADAREARQSDRLLARIGRLKREQEAVAGLLATADAASRAVLARRLEQLAGRIAEAGGIDVGQASLPAPKAEATHRRVGSRFEPVNGTTSN